MMTTMTADGRAKHPLTCARSAARNEPLETLFEEIAAWLMLAGFAVACLLVFAVAIAD